MKKRPQVSRTHVYFHVVMTSGFASRDLRSQFHSDYHLNFIVLEVTNSPCQFEHFEIWFVKIKWRSDRRSREHVAMTSGLASRAECRPLLSMWHAIPVSSSVFPVSSSTSKFDLLKSNEESTEGLENTCLLPRPNDIWLRISRPSVAISFRLSSEFHCARSDKQSLSVRALRNLIC